MAHEIGYREVVDREDRCGKLGSGLLGCFCILPASFAVLKGADLDPNRVLVPSLRASGWMYL